MENLYKQNDKINLINNINNKNNNIKNDKFIFENNNQNTLNKNKYCFDIQKLFLSLKIAPIAFIIIVFS